MHALLEHGVDINAQDHTGLSPLHVAVGEAGRIDITEKVSVEYKRLCSCCLYSSSRSFYSINNRYAETYMPSCCQIKKNPTVDSRVGNRIRPVD